MLCRLFVPFAKEVFPPFRGLVSLSFIVAVFLCKSVPLPAEGAPDPESSDPPVRHSMRFDTAPGGGIHSDSDEFNRVNDEIVSRESPLAYSEFFEMIDSHDFDPSERLMLWQVATDRQNPPISKEDLKALYAEKRASIGDFYASFHRQGYATPFVCALKGDDRFFTKSVSTCLTNGSEEGAVWVTIRSIVKSEYRESSVYFHPDGKRSVNASVRPLDQVDLSTTLMSHFPDIPLYHAWLSGSVIELPGCKPRMSSFLEQPVNKVFEKPETLNGRSCLVVGNFNEKLYLDPEKDYAVYAVELYHPAPPGGPLLGPGLYLSQRTVLHGLKDYGGGVWLPESVETFSYDPDGSVKPMGGEFYDEIKVNSGLPDSLFTDLLPENESFSEVRAAAQSCPVSIQRRNSWHPPYHHSGAGFSGIGYSYAMYTDPARVTRTDSEEFNRTLDEIAGRESPLSFGEFQTLVNQRGLNLQERANLWAVMRNKQNPPVSKAKLRSLYEKKLNFIGDFSSSFHIGLKNYKFAQKGEDRLYFEGYLERYGGYTSRYYEIASRTDSAFRTVIRGPEVGGKSPVMALIMPVDILATCFSLYSCETPLSQAWLFRAKWGHGVTGADFCTFLDSEFSTVFEKPEMLDGRSYVVVGNLLTKLYLDPEKDYSVCSVETYLPLSGNDPGEVALSVKSILHGLKDYGGGVWLPESAEVIHYNADGSVDSREEFAYDEIKINSGIPDSFFEGIIPEDAVVIDTRAK